MNELKERKYLAISLKHSTKNHLLFWGDHRTQDNEDRCFRGYTDNPKEAELYSIEEFHNKHITECFYAKETHMVYICAEFAKWKRNHDTVLVPEEDVLIFFKIEGWLK